MRRPVLVVHHVRSGIAALNVVSAALDADARTRGADVVFARSAEETARAVADVCARGERAVVAWSFYSTDFPGAAADLDVVRRSVPASASDVLHLAGGVHATAEPRATLLAGFDLVVVGEGEATMVEVFDAFARGDDPRRLPGTAHLASGELVTHGPGPRHPLDAYPAFNVRYGKWNAIEITRGCVYACSFCQTPYMFKARFRHRSPGDVCAHLRALVAQGGNGFVRFVSPTSLSYGSEDTSVNLAAVEALLAGVRETLGPEGKIYFGTFPSEIRPEHVSREALALLTRYVDNRSLVIGGQSGSERVLQATRRGHGVSDIVRAVQISVEAGFRPDVDFLLGVPGETHEDRAASIDLARKIVGMGARIHSHAFLPLPGTPLRDGLPEAIEPEVERAMMRLESSGAMYGQWRKHVIAARDLVRMRRERAS